jgi:hypothetical protein
MFELLTCKDPYTERNPGVIAARVVAKAARPQVRIGNPEFIDVFKNRRIS